MLTITFKSVIFYMHFVQSVKLNHDILFNLHPVILNTAQLKMIDETQ